MVVVIAVRLLLAWCQIPRFIELVLDLLSNVLHHFLLDGLCHSL